MGNKQSSSKSIHESSTAAPRFKYQEYEHELMYGQSKNLRPKRNLYNSNNTNLGREQNQMNRSTSSPLVTKPRLNNNSEASNTSNQRQHQQHHQPPPQQYSPIPKLDYVPQYLAPKVNSRTNLAQSVVISANNELKAKQVDLTTAIKKLDSEPKQPSHLNSKLYKPNSLLLAASLSSNQVKTNPQNIKNSNVHQYNNPNNQNNLSNGYNTLPVNTHPDVMKRAANNFNDQNANLKNNLKNSKSNDGLANKMGKKLGLSPKFKRKIVETIANRVNGNQNNGKVTRFF
jgi:hypothetical protein